MGDEKWNILKKNRNRIMEQDFRPTVIDMESFEGIFNTICCNLTITGKKRVFTSRGKN
jgi:hypothetical protein